MPFLSWEEYVFSRNAQNNLDGRLVTFSKAFRETALPENLEALKNLIQNDIIGSIKKNLDAGNITADDARRLRRLTQQLYDHIYSHYEEMEVLNEMTDESLMLDIDIIEKEHEKQLAEKDSVISEQSLVISEKNAVISEKDAEIALLKQQLAELQKIQHQK